MGQLAFVRQVAQLVLLLDALAAIDSVLSAGRLQFEWVDQERARGGTQ